MEPFFAGPISAFETLEPGQTTSVVNAEGTIVDVIHHDEADTELVYCVGLEHGGRDYSADTCYTAADIGSLNASFNVDALDGTTITPQSNVWWHVIDAGRQVTYTLVADDSRTGDVTLG